MARKVRTETFHAPDAVNADYTVCGKSTTDPGVYTHVDGIVTCRYCKNILKAMKKRKATIAEATDITVSVALTADEAFWLTYAGRQDDLTLDAFVQQIVKRAALGAKRVME